MVTTRDKFPQVFPDTSTRYCWECGADAITQKREGQITQYLCSSCSVLSERFLTWDPKLRATFDDKNRLVHYGGGAFVKNAEGKFLLIKQAKFPFLWTIPGGHLEVGEDPQACAVREVLEETGLTLQHERLVFDGVIEGDSCVGGADVHHWYLYCGDAVGTISVQDDEVTGSRWVALSDIDHATITFPLRFFLMNESVVGQLKKNNQA